MGNSIIDAIARTGLSEPPEVRAADLQAQRVAAQTRSGQTSKTRQTFETFETMVLQNFIQSMLPENAEAVYGEGIAGDIWKSFMAKGIAEQMAKHGGIGIADRVLGDHYYEGEHKVALSGVSHDPDKPQVDARNLLSSAAVQELQRDMVRQIGDDLTATGATGVFSDK